MSDYKERNENEIFTKVLKAGRRTYFFDVHETKAGDYYLPLQKAKRISVRMVKDFRKAQNLFIQRRFREFQRNV